MPNVSQLLRTARLEQNLSLQDVVDATKLKTDHVIALEEGRYTVFAAPVYVRGFLRSYAGLLKLDVPAVMKQLEAELGQVEKFREPGRDGGKKGLLDWVMLKLAMVNWRIALPVLILVVLVGITALIYRTVRSHQAADPLSGLGPGLYKPARPGGDTLPLPTNGPAKK
ncbi:MAG: helix-turn-helix domain-containing protein [Verrucomicrobia bacterium]|nr:helix-turn-helix domain-containing protein [Verrucomicrobiota bacterium]